MTRASAAAERIRDEIPLIQVLAGYGYDVDPRGEDHEQQFSCDLHGGADNKPSARYYPTNQFFCFACGRSRDAITLVQEKEGVTFWKAVRLLEKEYGLDPLPWSPEDQEQTPRQVVEEALRRKESPQEALDRAERLLFNLTQERSLTIQQTAGFWEVLDQVQHLQNDDKDPEEVLRLARLLLAKTKEALKKKVV